MCKRVTHGWLYSIITQIDAHVYFEKIFVAFGEISLIRLFRE